MNTTAWCERSCWNEMSPPFPLSFTKMHYRLLETTLSGERAEGTLVYLDEFAAVATRFKPVSGALGNRTDV
jgi:hypothetical protein